MLKDSYMIICSWNIKNSSIFNSSSCVNWGNKLFQICFFSFLKKLILCVWMFYCMYACALCTCLVHAESRREFMKLQLVVNHYVGARSWTWVLLTVNSSLQPFGISFLVCLVYTLNFIMTWEKHILSSAYYIVLGIVWESWDIAPGIKDWLL